MSAQSTTRVLFLVNSIPPESNRTRYQHAMALAEHYELTVIAKGEVAAPVMEAATKTESFGERWEFDPLLPLWLLVRALLTDCAIVVTEPSAAYVVAGWGRSLVGARWVADIWDDPGLVVESYQTNPGWRDRPVLLYHLLLTRLGGALLSRADVVIASIHPGLLEKYDIPDERIVELTNGIRESLVSDPDEGAHTTSDGPVKVVYVGHVKAQRRIAEYVSALEAVTDPVEVHLVGPTDQATEAAVGDLDLPVHVHGRLPHDDALDVVTESDIALCLLAPDVENYHYAYPVKLFEYAASDTAIVASDFPGIRQILTDGKDALLVDPTDRQAVRESVERLIADPDLRHRLQCSARERVEAFSWDRITDEYITAVDGAASRPNAGHEVVYA